MNIDKILTPADEESLRVKMTKEFQRADVHTSNWKSEVEDVGRDYLFPKPEQDKVKVRKIWNNLKIVKSLFLSDNLQVTSIPWNWQLGKDISENTNKILKANYRSMNIREKYEEVIIDDALQWVWVLAVDGWNDHDQEPIVSYIDSRLTYPDPANWRGNKMKFFWTLLRKSIFELESDDAYDKERVEKVKLQKSTELDKIARANNQIKWFTDVDLWEEEVDVYNHITIFKTSKDTEYNLYLTTWGVDRTTLIRIVKMRALTETEKSDPSKITTWVQLFRKNPIKWSYAWATLIDEIGQYQDLETLLTNLQISQAIEAWLWGKTFVDDSLWIDTDDLASIQWPAVIPYKSNDPNKNAANSIINEQPRVNNPAVQNWILLIQWLSQEWSSTSNSLVQWQSQWGDQTKAEVQTLQQNLNQQISLMASNYMESWIGLWSDVMRSYSVNMSPQRKKEIITVDSKWKPDSYGFKKNQFVSKGDVYIQIVSKAEEDVRNKQDFAILLSVIWTLKQSVKPWSVPDMIIDRLLIDKSWIRGIKWEDLKPLSSDERQAYEDLELLNNNIKVSKPEQWQDHETYIRIYKTGLETVQREMAIIERESIIKEESKTKPVEEMQWVWGWVAQQMWASMIASDNAQWKTPSIQDVSV